MNQYHNLYYFFKTSIDYLAALLALIALLPLFAVIAIAIRIESEGDIFFRQERVGRFQKRFYIIKFRTMRNSVPFDIDNPVIHSSSSSLTRVGKFLRRTKLDELPQIINILRGEMSFIGPRPFVPDYLGRYEQWELEKFQIKPGLTGWAQVHGNGWLELNNRSYYDIEYIHRLGLGIELSIVLKSFLVVIFGEEKFCKPITAGEIYLLKREIYQDQINTRFKRDVTFYPRVEI